MKKKPTFKDLQKIENSKSSLKEILKIHIKEPFTENEIRGLHTNLKNLKKNNCHLYYGNTIHLGQIEDVVNLENFLKMAKDGYFILTSPQLHLRLMYVKVFGGSGMLWGKKIYYNIYLQDYGEDTWTPGGVFKMWSLAVIGVNNIFREEGLLSGSAI